MDRGAAEPSRTFPGGPFGTTHWSVVLAARDGTGTRAASALEALCRTYWAPIYTYLRRTGRSSHDAQDLTQGFLAHFLAHGHIQRLRHRDARFRSFLLCFLKRYLSDERDKAMAEKRGGGRQIVSWEECSLEERRHGAIERLSAGEAFDRRWAMALLERSQFRLRQEYADAGREGIFGELQPFLGTGEACPTCAELAARMAIPENTVKSLIHRLRRRYGELIREEVAQTVASAAEVDEEIRYLLGVVAD